MTFTSNEEALEPPVAPAPSHSTPIGDFERIRRMSAGAPHNEWMAVLPDATEVVVSETAGDPDPLEIQKAISIVQSRAYLGKRAVQLIAPFLRAEGTWRLLTIDFGAAARRCGSEFLMCFAFVGIHATLSKSSPYFEVGFSLPPSSFTDDTPTFSVTVKTIVGIPFP